MKNQAQSKLQTVKLSIKKVDAKSTGVASTGLLFNKV
jgi:hypothetical protein